MAFTFLNGNTPEPTTTLYDAPSQLFVPEVVTRDNLKAIVIDTGIVSAAELCTGEFAQDCADLGIE